MTVLRQKMIEDMQLRGLSARTQEAYVGAVRQLAEYYGQSPEQLSKEQLRRYFLYLKNEKKASRSSCAVVLAALKFLAEQTLGRSWPILGFVQPGREHKLPEVLSVAEVRRVLGQVRQPHYRVCLYTIYACGLRTAGQLNGDTGHAVSLGHGRWFRLACERKTALFCPPAPLLTPDNER